MVELIKLFLFICYIYSIIAKQLSYVVIYGDDNGHLVPVFGARVSPALVALLVGDWRRTEESAPRATRVASGGKPDPSHPPASALHLCGP